MERVYIDELAKKEVRMGCEESVEMAEEDCRCRDCRWSIDGECVDWLLIRTPVWVAPDEGSTIDGLRRNRA